MKKLFLFLLFNIALLAKLPWHHNLKHAFTLAKKEKKFVLIYIHQQNCYYCNKLEDEVFRDKETQKVLKKHYILVKLNIDQAIQYFPNTAAVPAIYIYSPNKKPLATQLGYQNIESFYWTLGEADRTYKALCKNETR